MDVALELLDPLVFDKAYAWALPHPGAALSNSTNVNGLLAADGAPASLWDRDNIYRQSISILLITQFGASALYFIFSALSYYLVFDRRLEYHPRFLKNQVRQEIKSSMTAVPFINILTLPWFLGEVRGHSLLYGDVKSYGWSWLIVSSLLYMAFNDVAIYWIHRLEHHPSVYKYIHKPHHKWIGQCSVTLHRLVNANIVQSLHHGLRWLSTLLTATYNRCRTSTFIHRATLPTR
jgi:lathosterol oxidase